MLETTKFLCDSLCNTHNKSTFLSTRVYFLLNAKKLEEICRKDLAQSLPSGRLQSSRGKVSPCSQTFSDKVSCFLGNMEQRGLCKHVCQTPDTKSSVMKAGVGGSSHGISQYIYVSFVSMEHGRLGAFLPVVCFILLVKIGLLDLDG